MMAGELHAERIEAQAQQTERARCVLMVTLAIETFAKCEGNTLTRENVVFILNEVRDSIQGVRRR